MKITEKMLRANAKANKEFWETLDALNLREPYRPLAEFLEKNPKMVDKVLAAIKANKTYCSLLAFGKYGERVFKIPMEREFKALRKEGIRQERIWDKVIIRKLRYMKIENVLRDFKRPVERTAMAALMKWFSLNGISAWEERRGVYSTNNSLSKKTTPQAVIIEDKAFSYAYDKICPKKNAPVLTKKKYDKDTAIKDTINAMGNRSSQKRN